MANTLSRIWNRKAEKHVSQGFSQTHIVFAIIGLCVAIATYFILNLSIHGLIHARNGHTTRKAVLSYFEVLDQKQIATDSIASILELATPEDVQKLKYKLLQQSLGGLTRQVDYIGLYYRADQESGILDPLYGRGDVSLVLEDDEAALQAVLDSERLDSSEPQIFLQTYLFDGAVLLDGSGTKPFAFVKKVSLSFADEAMVVLVGRFESVIDQNWIDGHPMLGSIQVRDIATGQPLYDYERDLEPLDRLHEARTNDFVFGGLRWAVKTRFLKDNIIFVLEFIPLLAVLAVGLLTFLAVLYVYSQQKQAARMRRMNIALEDKNAALEHEVEKRETLNRNLKKSEQENRAVIDSISDIIFETNVDGDLLYVNAAWPRITGFSVMQSRDKNLFSLLHPEDQDKERERFSLLVRGQKPAYRTFTRLRTRDGTFRAIELSISVMRRSSEGAMHVVGAMTDIEERRRAEQALGEAEKKYRAIVENAAWGIFQMTPEGIYLSANYAMVDILGYANIDDMLHGIRNAHEQVYGNERERKVFLREVEMQGVINNHEVQVYDREGQPMWVAENIRAVKDDAGNVLYYEGSLEDITDRKEADLMLRDAKLHSDMANRAKSEFLTNMSHELRTPLNAIIGFSEILRDETFGPLGDDAYKDYVQDIHKSGKGLLQIINEILEISKIEVRERELNEDMVQVYEVVESCLSLLGNKIHAHQIEVLNMIEDRTPLIAEERALKQIVMNILSNAVKFTPRGGRVTLRYEIADTGEAVISVADTGVGLEPAQIKKALSPFGQVNSTLDTDNAGTGLGLTLVKALVDLHGGKLEIFSQKGMGTTVSVKMPPGRVHMTQGKDHTPVS